MHLVDGIYTWSTKETVCLLNHFRSYKLFHFSESQAADVPGGLLEWHFICFFPQSSYCCWEPQYSARWQLVQHNKGFPSSQIRLQSNSSSFLLRWSSTRCFYTLFLPPSLFTSSCIIVKITSWPVQAIKGQSSLHCSAWLVCREETNAKGMWNEPGGSQAEHALNTQVCM